MTIVSNLKQQSDYYNRNRRTLGTFARTPGATACRPPSTTA
jgi:hypothetical protein